MKEHNGKSTTFLCITQIIRDEIAHLKVGMSKT